MGAAKFAIDMARDDRRLVSEKYLNVAGQAHKLALHTEFQVAAAAENPEAVVKVVFAAASKSVPTIIVVACLRKNLFDQIVQFNHRL